METKQRIYLDENKKLVVETNNAFIDGYNKTITSLNGEFTIDANNVAKLLSMINKTNMYCYNGIFCSEARWFIGDANDLTHQLECEIKLREEREKIIEEKKQECFKIDRENTKIIRKIENFNETRHWWERKFKIYEE